MIPYRPMSAQDRTLERAATIFARHGEDSLSPFILRSDKRFLFAAGGTLAYRSVGRTTIASGDPVGPPESIGVLVEQLLARARADGRRVVVYGASARHLETYRRLGLRAVCVGEEAVVDPARFTLEGRAVRKLRQSVNRVARRGWRIAILEGHELDARVVRELRELDGVWRAAGGNGRGFAMATDRPGHVAGPDDVFALGWSPAGRLSASLRFLAHRGRLSLDTTQRAGDTTNGLGEALICHLLAWACREGVAEVSLNYAGLGHLVRRAPEGGLLRRTLTRALLRVLGCRFQMDRLVMFNEKFHPEWRPRYLVYASRLALPMDVMRVLQAEGYLAAPRDGEALVAPGDWVPGAGPYPIEQPLSA